MSSKTRLSTSLPLNAETAKGDKNDDTKADDPFSNGVGEFANLIIRRRQDNSNPSTSELVPFAKANDERVRRGFIKYDSTTSLKWAKHTRMGSLWAWSVIVVDKENNAISTKLGGIL